MNGLLCLFLSPVQGPQGEPGPPGQQGMPGPHVSSSPPLLSLSLSIYVSEYFPLSCCVPHSLFNFHFCSCLPPSTTSNPLHAPLCHIYFAAGGTQVITSHSCFLNQTSADILFFFKFSFLSLLSVHASFLETFPWNYFGNRAKSLREITRTAFLPPRRRKVSTRWDILNSFDST